MKRWSRRMLAGLALAALAGWLGRRASDTSAEGARREGAEDTAKPPVRRTPKPAASAAPKASVGEGRRAPRSTLAADSPWASREACLRQVERGARLARKAGRARLVAWNVRWFPDGGPGKRPSKNPTDVVWLACAMAYLNADVFALQEVKAYPRARQKLEEVQERLGAHEQAPFHARLDDCEPVAAQHVGLMWNAKRVRAENFEMFAELNPLAGPCQNQLRPGLGARFLFAGGLDLQIVAAHLKSGGEPRSFALRERSLARLPELLDAVERRHQDEDLVVLGDFNVMGCKGCTPVVDGAGERRAVGELLSRGSKPLAVLPTAPACSHYFSGTASLLDLVVAPRAMRELGAAPEVVPSGLCAELGCGPLPEPWPEAHRRLSDHCPIVIDLEDQDLD